VSTLASGTADFTSAFFCTMSHGSPSNGMAAAMNLVPSSTEPPPTASRNPAFSARASFTASISVRYSGFGWMPPNSMTVQCASAALTWS